MPPASLVMVTVTLLSIAIVCIFCLRVSKKLCKTWDAQGRQVFWSLF